MARLTSCARALRALLNVNGPVCTRARRSYATVPVEKPSRFGQPVFGSHPHLLAKNELTPGIPTEEYETRRKKLMDALPDDAAVVAVSAPVKYMSGEIFYKYRQDSNFWYLTGFQEPDSAVILEKDLSTSRGYRMTLFIRGRDADREQWDGARSGPEEATSIFGADKSLTIDYFMSHLKSLNTKVYLDWTPSQSPSSVLPWASWSSSRSRKQSGRLRSLFESFVDVLRTDRKGDLGKELGKLRSIKSEAEVRVMKAAADLSGSAHTKTMRFTRPGLSESALAAHFEYICALGGAQRPAYVPVVASGGNALVIHYTTHDHIARDGEMVLLDAGCEYNGYASDITRTFPVNGTFTSAQKDLYSAVLSAQKQCIQLCSESAGMSMNSLHAKSCEYLKEELNQLGFDSTMDEVKNVLYPHFLSHPIGIDLHESSHFTRNALLKTGMVITIEPGIYVPPTSRFPKHFHNMGIRIEDQVLIQPEHPIVLSANAPKEVVDVEAACQGSLGLEPY